MGKAGACVVTLRNNYDPSRPTLKEKQRQSCPLTGTLHLLSAQRVVMRNSCTERAGRVLPL
eukprot:6189351-Pleurochrysis_carterae.AAC.3